MVGWRVQCCLTNPWLLIPHAEMVGRKASRRKAMHAWFVAHVEITKMSNDWFVAHVAITKMSSSVARKLVITCNQDPAVGNSDSCSCLVAACLHCSCRQHASPQVSLYRETKGIVKSHRPTTDRRHSRPGISRNRILDDSLCNLDIDRQC